MDQVKFVEDSFQDIWSYMVTSKFLKAVFHIFYLVHSWIPWPKYIVGRSDVYNENTYRVTQFYNKTVWGKSAYVIVSV